MSTRLSLLLIVCLFTGLCCCDDSEPPAEEPVLEVETSASAKPADDAKSSGVYKGTFVGSSGYFKLVLEHDNITGVLMVDGTGYGLTTADISTSDLGSAISNAIFTDASKTVTLTFSVNADGSNPVVELEITGHETIEVHVSKEQSDGQVLIYQGFEYATDVDHGVQCKTHLNLILASDSIGLSVYKSVGEIPLNNGHTGSCETRAGIGQYTYYIINEKLYIQFGYPWLFSNSSADWSEDEIHSAHSWEYEGFVYGDSTRLKRVL